MSQKICFMSPYPKMTLLIAQALGGFPDPPMVIETEMNALKTATQILQDQKPDVFVTTKYQSRFLRNKIKIPIIIIPLTEFDIILAIKQAITLYGNKVAFFEPLKQNPHLETICEILDCEIKKYIFDGEKDAISKVNQAKLDGCPSGVGGGIAEGIAQKIGLNFVPLFPSTKSIVKAFRQAQQILDVQRTERYEAMKFKYTVQYTFSGIIVTDQYGIITVFNSAAERMLLIKAAQALNRSIDKVIPQTLHYVTDKITEPRLEEIKTIGKKKFMINVIPILDGNCFFGTILNLQEFGHIQSLEEKIRRESHSKGLIAKMTFEDVVGISHLSKKIIQRAKRFATSDETIFITGESGTGKEIFAQSIHNQSNRRSKPFVAVNCATIPKSLVESELFGYIDGAFTGAKRGGKKGYFELAHGGTIFLDEIGELLLEDQVSLLRVLQEKEIMRIGDDKVIPVDVRVVAATNINLENALEHRLFRLDLFHRLNILRISLPPLKERKKDILPLIHLLLCGECLPKNLAIQIETIIAKHAALIYNYSWPGNIRELQNLLKRIVVSAKCIGDDSLESEIILLLNEALNSNQMQRETYSVNIEDNIKSIATNYEKLVIEEKMKEFKGNKTQLAKKLGISRSTLYRKLRKDMLVKSRRH